MPETRMLIGVPAFLGQTLENEGMNSQFSQEPRGKSHPPLIRDRLYLTQLCP